MALWRKKNVKKNAVSMLSNQFSMNEVSNNIFDYIPKNLKWMIVHFSQIDTTEDKDGPIAGPNAKAIQGGKWIEFLTSSY